LFSAQISLTLIFENATRVKILGHGGVASTINHLCNFWLVLSNDGLLTGLSCL